jgi:hypothetical protein
MNSRQEIAACLDDCKDCFPEFGNAEILRTDTRNIGDEWPGYRAWPGYDIPQGTTIPNLLNVGDGVKPFGASGTVACAETARLAVNEIKKHFKPQE